VDTNSISSSGNCCYSLRGVLTVNDIVIGKRVQVGAAITGAAAVLAHFFPEYAVAIIAAVAPITFGVQVAIAHFFGVTVK
jgi:hypothetical protein